MRKVLPAACLSAAIALSVCASLAATPPPAKPAPGSLVILFKDGHKQSFSLADIERIEFSAGDRPASSLNPSGPSRGHYLGKWEVGDGNGGMFTITLSEDGGAFRTLGAVHGKWVYSNGEALITWDDGAQDAIRLVDGGFQKFAYEKGKSFTDRPDNVTSARNIMPNPI